jgi:hypothetical protein
VSFVSPITLQAQISLPAQAGELGLADSTRLENPFQAPMWLDEIKFHIPYVPVDPFANPIVVVPLRWSQLYVKLYLGNIPITNGAVPLSLLCKQLNDSAVPGSNPAAPALPIVPTEQGTPVTYNVYTWKLPKPLFIPARDFLRPVIYYAPSPTSLLPLTPVAVNIIYSCRPLAKGTPTPKKLQIPWATYYAPPMMDSISGGVLVDQTDQSTPSDLYNPFEQELHVQRFVGRFLNYQVGADLDPTDNNFGDVKGVMAFADELVDFSNNVPLSGTFVSAQDSMNNILIRDPTPFTHVFDVLDRSWTVNCILPPKGFYLFTIDRLWGHLGTEFNYRAAATVGIGMIGWRDVFYAKRG